MDDRVLARLEGRLATLRPGVVEGRITSVSGVTLFASGLEAPVGEICRIRTLSEELLAEVVGFREGRTVLMPLGGIGGVGPGAAVRSLGRPFTVRAGEEMVGRVVDALGRPLDGRPLPPGVDVPVDRISPMALDRVPIREPLVTGVSSIDGFLTIGRGQRMGIFAGSGVGKSTLLGMVCREARADVNVIALVGERGREVKEFLDNVLGPEGMARSVVVVTTSDSAPLLRHKGPQTAVSLAEYFRDQGRDVLLVMDSVTRFAFAAREIGLSAGEPPTMRGYPPSLFAQLPRLVERMGTSGSGSITGLLTVLVEGDDMNEPVADAMRSLLDGHIVLSRDLAALGHYPPVDIRHSVSRLMDQVISPEHRRAAEILREELALYEENRDLIQVGAYKQGVDPRLDRVINKIEYIQALLKQGVEERRGFEETLKVMTALVEENG